MDRRGSGSRGSSAASRRAGSRMGTRSRIACRKTARAARPASRLDHHRPTGHTRPMRSFVLVALVVPLAGCAVRVPQARDCDPRSAARPVCGLQNPEDVVALPGTRWLLATEFRRPGDPPGSIVAFTLDGDRATTVVGPSAPAERLVDPIFEKNAEICP